MSAREMARKIERLFGRHLTRDRAMALCDVVEQAIDEAVAAEREKPAPLVWEPILGSAAQSQVAQLGEWESVVWYKGGEYPWRSRHYLAANGHGTSGGMRARTVSHFAEASAKASAERRLRKAGA